MYSCQGVVEVTIIAVPATLRTIRQKGVGMEVTMATEGEEQLEHLQELQERGGPWKEGAEEVVTHPQVGGVHHELTGMTTGVTPLLHRRRSLGQDHQHGATTGSYLPLDLVCVCY